MTDKNWKARERRVARKMSGRRIPLSGRSNLGHVGDVLLAGYTTEVKSGRRQIPKSVEGWLATLRSTAEAGTIPVLVLCPFGKQEQVAILMLTDFAKLADAARGGTP